MQWIKTSEDFFKKYTSHFIVRFTCERELETEQNCNILTPTLMAISVVSFSFSWCSTGGPGAQLSAGWWLSLPHLITNWSGPQTPSGVPRAPSAGWWLSLPHLVSNSSDLQFLTSCLTELYNSSIANSIAHSIFRMACLIVIKRK